MELGGAKAGATPANGRSRFAPARMLPGLAVLRRYHRQWLRGDLLAGIMPLENGVRLLGLTLGSLEGAEEERGEEEHSAPNQQEFSF